LFRPAEQPPGALEVVKKKGIFVSFDKTSSRFESVDAPSSASEIQLTSHQEQALSKIRESFDNHDVTLLHGITSSGKTEIYIKLIEEMLLKDKQVLYLLPEIALTSHIINRLRKYFGSKVGIYHSKYNENERVEVWNNVLNHAGDGPEALRKTPVILGARSALFLPFADLGLIIVDEEHDTSFKQMDPAPRYNARDTAIFLGHLHKAKIILGSATPSLETMTNALNHKYGLAKLNERYGGMEVPEVIIADLKKENRYKTSRSHFSGILLSEINTALENKEQVILFQNRRGFSTRIECETCQWIPQCIHCDISLTYHKYDKSLKCHYCGYSSSIPDECPECKSTRILTRGFGTEKVEEELQLICPEARIRRMDLDTTRTKYGHLNILEDFGDGQIDILVGTQMVTKGLDFEKVSVVGILNADNMINFPDFRAVERSFQLMEQVSGRAGRKYRRGKVIVQTYNTKHPVIQWILNHDYQAMIDHEQIQRQKFRYPPFYRLVIIRVKHRDNREARNAALSLTTELKKVLGKRVLGPEYPLVSRIRNLYIQQILIKLEKSSSLVINKGHINETIDKFKTQQKNKKTRIIIDVDPM